MSDKKNSASKRPKTAMDRTFLAITQQLMAENKIPSERAMSAELGQNVNFISRVRTGVQSVPADIWGVLISKFNLKSFTIEEDDTPASFNVSGTANVVGTNAGTATQTNNYHLADCEKERDDCKAQLEKMAAENDSLRRELFRADAMIGAKEALIILQAENLKLLRGGLDRMN